jgi:hypothetical protein
MLSSFRGQRGGAWCVGVFDGGGIAGLKVEVEGTRTGATWRAREAAVGLVGDDGPARKRGAEGIRASLRGLGDWAMTRDFLNEKKNIPWFWLSWQGHKRKGQATYSAWCPWSVDTGGRVIYWKGWWFFLGRWRCDAYF